MSLPGPGLRSSVLCTWGGLQSPVTKAFCAPGEEAQRREWALRKPMEGYGWAIEELGRCRRGGGSSRGAWTEARGRQSLCGGYKEAGRRLGPAAQGQGAAWEASTALSHCPDWVVAGKAWDRRPGGDSAVGPEGRGGPAVPWAPSVVCGAPVWPGHPVLSTAEEAGWFLWKHPLFCLWNLSSCGTSPSRAMQPHSGDEATDMVPASGCACACTCVLSRVRLCAARGL